MISNSSVRMAHQYGASKEAFEKATQIMCSKVSIPCSDRYNSVYDEMDLHRSLIALSISNGYAESGMQKLAMQTAVASKSRGSVPSGSWVRGRVESVSEKEMMERLDHALHSTVDEVESHRVFSTPIMAAIDKHKIPRYDQKIEPFLTRSKRDRGTNLFETYATLQCVEEGRRAQIACEHAGFFDGKDELVCKLITDARLNGLKISLLLMDREFFSSSVINALKRNGQRFLTPCVLHSGIKKAIQQYANGERELISQCTLTPSEGEPAEFTLVILPKAGCDDEERDPLKRYIPFATNIPLGDILWNVHKLPRDYRMRWGIETGYVGVEELRARTTSRNHALRLLYFYYALILYNAWLLANLIMARELSKPLTHPVIPLPMVKAVLEGMIIHSLGGG